MNQFLQHKEYLLKKISSSFIDNALSSGWEFSESESEELFINYKILTYSEQVFKFFMNSIHTYSSSFSSSSLSVGSNPTKSCANLLISCTNIFFLACDEESSPIKIK